MNPPETKTRNEEPLQRQEEKERPGWEENAKKARQTADKEFPSEKWKKLDEGIYLSPRRPIGEKTSFVNEKKDAEILKSLGSTVYLVAEVRSDKSKKYDAIVNGEKMEFKNITGNAATLADQFLNSRRQAPNVFINIESNLSKHEVIGALIGARNNPRYERRNKFPGGKIILKFEGDPDLLRLNVDDLKK